MKVEYAIRKRVIEFMNDRMISDAAIKNCGASCSVINFLLNGFPEITSAEITIDDLDYIFQVLRVNAADFFSCDLFSSSKA